jgi:hypothetical protein
MLELYFWTVPRFRNTARFIRSCLGVLHDLVWCKIDYALTIPRNSTSRLRHSLGSTPRISCGRKALNAQNILYPLRHR